MSEKPCHLIDTDGEPLCGDVLSDPDVLLHDAGDCDSLGHIRCYRCDIIDDYLDRTWPERLEAEDDEESEAEETEDAAFQAFLAEHPEIAGAYIGERDELVCLKWGLDPVLDREYVGWAGPGQARWDYKAKGYPAPFCDQPVSEVQVIAAVRRAVGKLGRPASASEILRELWGEDGRRDDVSRLGVWLAFHGPKVADVRVDRTAKPNRYAVAERSRRA